MLRCNLFLENHGRRAGFVIMALNFVCPEKSETDFLFSLYFRTVSNPHGCTAQCAEVFPTSPFVCLYAASAISVICWSLQTTMLLKMYK